MQITFGMLWLVAFALVSVAAISPVPEERVGWKITSIGSSGRELHTKSGGTSLARREERSEQVEEKPMVERSAPLYQTSDMPQSLPPSQSRETRPAAYNDALMQVVRSSLSDYRKTIEARSVESRARRHSIGTVVVLLDTSDVKAMHDIQHVLVPSMMEHIKFSTSVVVFFMGSRRRTEDVTINLHLNPFLQLHLEDVTDRIKVFSNEELQLCQGSRQVDDWQINQFWTMHVHMLPELQVFKYAWRLYPSSSIDADITADLYTVMQNKSAIFGFRSLRNEKIEACTGLEDATKNFFEEHTSFSPKVLNSKTYLSLFEEAKCPGWSPDFQITDLDYLRNSEPYQMYVKHLSQMGGFCKFGWGGHGVQALFVETQEAKQPRLLCVKPWVPKFHGPMASFDCQEGQSLIAFLRDAINDQLHAPQASMGEVQELKRRNATSKEEKVQASKAQTFLVHALAFLLKIWRRYKLLILTSIVLGLFGMVNIGGYLYLRKLRLAQQQDKAKARSVANAAKSYK